MQAGPGRVDVHRALLHGGEALGRHEPERVGRDRGVHGHDVGLGDEVVERVGGVLGERRRDAHGDLALGTGVDLRGASGARSCAARTALERDRQQTLGREPVEVIGGECAADPGLGGHLVPAHRVWPARDLVVDAAPSGVPERTQGLQRIHRSILSLTRIDKYPCRG